MEDVATVQITTAEEVSDWFMGMQEWDKKGKNWRKKTVYSQFC